jgi:hypothetical protein
MMKIQRGEPMKRYFGLVLLASIILSGCGVEWFPDDSSSSSATAPSLSMAFNPSSVSAGTTSTLTFTINNGTGNPAQSGLGFSDQLDPALTVGAVNAGTCGGQAVISGSKITFSNGSLSAGTASCTVTATVSGTVSGTNPVNYTNKASDFTGLVGGLTNGAADQTLTIFPASSIASGAVTVSHLTFYTTSDSSNVTYFLTVDATNSGPGVAIVQVTVAAVDALGIDIATVNATVPYPGPFQTVAVTTTPVQIAGLAIVPVADAVKIQFWRIVSVTEQ